MTIFGRWVRRTIEKWLKRFYEGPNPPDRLGEIIVRWSNENPKATRGEFLSMAIQITEEAYMAGFTRGMEYVERDPEFFDELDPEGTADQMDPWWRVRPAVVLHNDPDEIVPDDEELALDVAVDIELGIGPE